MIRKSTLLPSIVGFLRSFSILTFISVSALAVPITVTVQPTSLAVHIGDRATLTASVSGTTNTGVTWAVNGIANGNGTVGTISNTGVYTPPAVLGTQSVKVTATSTADHTTSASAALTLENPVPVLTSITTASGLPGLLSGQAFTLTVAGSGFLPTCSATLSDGTVVKTSYQSPTRLVVSGTTTSPAGKTVRLTVANPNEGAYASNYLQIPIQSAIAVAVAPKTVSLRCLTSHSFTTTIANSSIKTVTWSVNGIAGGNATVGTVTPLGLYTAPAITPSQAVAVTATSTVDPTKSDSAIVTLQNAIPVITGTTSPITAGQTAVVTINGTGFARNAAVYVAGVAASTTWVSSIQLKAAVQVGTPLGGYSSVVVTNPDPGYAVSGAFPIQVNNSGTKLTYLAAKQFLEKATWGPTPDSIAHLQAIGIDAWLAEQFDPAKSPESKYPLPTDNSSINNLQSQFYINAVQGKDQLRQRLAFALSQIVVVSAQKIHGYGQIMPYEQMLLDDAFGTYHNLLKDVTLSPAMGRYLDMVNNDVPTPTLSANENYAREFMQLFTVGLAQLNVDGTETTTPSTPVYDENDVRGMARVLTGWTYPTCSGAPTWPNQPCYQGQMVPFENHHDQGSKSVLGVNIQTGSAEGDLDLALSTIESQHPANSSIPNIAPFIASRLIQHFVTGNPAPAYVARVAQVFAASGGDLKQVIAAVLKDPAATTSSGHLREPILYELALVRALNATVPSPWAFASAAADMGQNPFESPSVFNFYSPFFKLASNGQVAPEFQTLDQQSALARANYAYAITHNIWSPGSKVDYSQLSALAGDTNPATEGTSLMVILNAASQSLLGTPIRSDMAAVILPALQATTNPLTRVETAFYLLAVAPQYQVEQ